MSLKHTKRIVCLAYSHMPGGRCIAGREWLAGGSPGRWIRPVSGRDNEGVAESLTRYKSGGLPGLLDIIDVPVLAHQPTHHQKENWLIDAERRWEKTSRLSSSHLPILSDDSSSLWVNGDSSSAGLNDRVSLDAAKHLQGSLCLIKSQLALRVFDHYYQRRVQGQFWHNGENYWLAVTDPAFRQEYSNRDDGIYQLGERYFTLSLGGAFKDGKCYKLIAAIF